MEHKFDLIVIGTGAGGATAAHKCQKEGWQVAIIDSQPFGGTCALRGCDPKKVLVGASDLMDWMRRMDGNGVSSRDVKIDWSSLMRFKKTFTDPVPGNRGKGFASAGIAAFQGRTNFLNQNTLQVGNDVLTGRFVLIAAGAKPATLGISGEEYLTTSDPHEDGTSTVFFELNGQPREVRVEDRSMQGPHPYAPRQDQVESARGERG